MKNDLYSAFGNGDLRFRWQTKNLGENLELNGKLYRRFNNSENKNNISSDQGKINPVAGSWESLMQGSETNTKIRNLSQR